MKSLLLIALAATAFAQEADIRAAEKKWVTAIKARDAEALRAVLSDQLIYGHASGIVDNKSTYIDKVASGKQKYEGVEQGELMIRVHGDTAVVHTRMHVWGVNPDGKFDDKVMLLHVWLKEKKSGWRLIAHQTAKLQ